jgi:transcriptional regulator with XRE-family HTH domain
MSQTEDQHAFIDLVLAKTGWSQTDLAHRAGLDPSTLSRFLNKGRDGHALRPSSIQRVSNAAGIPYGDLMPRQPEGLNESEADPYVYETPNSQAAAIRALCVNRENVDAWTLNSRAIEGAGYKPGDILLVGLGETPLAGDVVCAQVYDWAKGRAETIFRIYQPPALVASTSDASLLRPYLISDTSVAIKGIVLHVLRSR